MTGDADSLERLRVRYGLLQGQLAARMGTSVSAIIRVEKGAHRPNVETLERLALAFAERLVLGFEDSQGRREFIEISRTGQQRRLLVLQRRL